jgi:hypothetical protein
VAAQLVASRVVVSSTVSQLVRSIFQKQKIHKLPHTMKDWGIHGDDYEECHLCSVLRLLVTANVPSSPILVPLMMEVIRSSETSVLTTATWHNIPEDDIHHSHHCENLKSYIALTSWAL